MKQYIVHNGNGEFLRTGICPDDMFELQAQNDEFVIEGTANDIEYRVMDGKIIRKTEAEIALIKEKMEPDAQEQLIQRKMNEILRRMATEELK